MSDDTVSAIKAIVNSLCMHLANAAHPEADRFQNAVEHGMDAFWRSLPADQKARLGVPTGSRENPFDD